VSGAALRQLLAPHGWGNPAGRVHTPASPTPPGGSRAWWCALVRVMRGALWARSERGVSVQPWSCLALVRHSVRHSVISFAPIASLCSFGTGILKWTWDAPDKIQTTPVVVANAVVLGCNDNFVYAIEIKCVTQTLSECSCKLRLHPSCPVRLHAPRARRVRRGCERRLDTAGQRLEGVGDRN